MREILFRGKAIAGFHAGKIVYGYLVKDFWHQGDCGIQPIDKTQGGYIEVNPETVGQYTGLTDKNGKKIFEGDIVRADDYVFSIQYGKCGGTPNADNYGYMGFYLEAVSEGTKACAKFGLRDDMCYFKDIEVIDNIHDNLLLFKGGAE